MHEVYIDSVTYGDDKRLEQLDEMLFELRTTMARRDFGRRLIDGLGLNGGFTALRILRAVQRLESGDDDASSIRSVADELVIEHSTASRAVEALVRSGHLAKSASPTDQRRSQLHLTARGRITLQEVTDRRLAIIAKATRAWPKEDVVRLTEWLGRLRRGMDAAL